MYATEEGLSLYNVDKFCVFCGGPPQDKNKEHVIPLWLIEMTGKPDRVANFGIDFNKEPISPRKFAFNSLVFPACSACNERFGELETRIKPIVERLLAHRPVGSYDFMLLLDWLDKVRVGLWLGYLYLDKNSMGIRPSFHILSRLGRFDRMVSIFRIDDAGLGLTFAGPHFKSYQLSPTCLGLRVNQLCFVNASGIALCSQRLGFPYMRPYRFREDHSLEALPEMGSGRIMSPVERTPLFPHSTTLYQPIFRSFCGLENSAQFLAHDWVKERTAHSELGLGKLFLQKADSVEMYPDQESADWIPRDTCKMSEIPSRLGEYVFSRIRKDYEASIGLGPTNEDRKHLRREGVMARILDHALLFKAR
jgi:hypothetical protein